MGVVFNGFASELNRPVAIKLLASHLAGSGAAGIRFAREAMNVADSLVLRRALHVAELADLERKLCQAYDAIEQRDRIKSKIADRRVEDLLNPVNRGESQRERVEANSKSVAGARRNKSVAIACILRAYFRL